MNLIIDTRESAIKELLKIPFESKPLDVGDILYEKDGIPVCLIERKTIQDLAASIKDGRAREQKARIKTLIDQHSDCQVIYLYETVMDPNKNYGLPIKTLYGSIVNTFIRDKFYVLHTQSVEETVVYIEKIYEKLVEHSSNTNVSKNKEYNYCAALSVKKKENITPKICFANQLAQIPSVSINVGLSVGEQYTSIKSLIDAYQKIDNTQLEELPIQKTKKKLEEAEYRELLKTEMLKDIPLLNSERKIGKKASEMIYTFLTKE